MEHGLAQLKAIAFGYGVDITGLRSKDQVRAALVSADIPGFAVIQETPANAKAAYVRLQALIDEVEHPHAELVPLLAYMRPLLARVGLALQADPLSAGGQIGFRLHFLHGDSGTDLIFEPVMFPAGSNVRSRSAAADVAKWYALMNALNLSTPAHDEMTAASIETDLAEKLNAATGAEVTEKHPGRVRMATAGQIKGIPRRVERLELTDAEVEVVFSTAGADPTRPYSEWTFDQASAVIDALAAIEAERKAKEARR